MAKDKKTNQELIKEFRLAFNALPKYLQNAEAGRINRIINNTQPIFAEPLEDQSRRFKFNTPAELIAFIKQEGIEVKSNSNVYKCLRGERENAYGYKIYYGKE